MTMKKLIKRSLATAIAVAMLAGCNDNDNNNDNDAQAPEKAAPKNFVTIVIDDMGYSDMGVFGSEIDTPNLDQLANQGVILSNFYAAATSSVSRSMLYSGKDNHKNGMGTMRELMARAPRAEQMGQPGYEGVLSLDTLPFPEVLEDNNYYTMMTGKWHMGGDEENEEVYYPFNRGFSATKSALLGGGDLDYMKNADGIFLTEHAETYDERVSLYNDNGAEADFTDLPNLTHSTENFTNSAIAMLEARDKTKPFYLNAAYLAPHGPLQAPKALIDKYVSTYAVGWDQVREDRLNRLKQMGYVMPDVALSPRAGVVKAWDDLTDREKRFEAQRMAVYAAEVEYLDQNIGRLVQYLKDIGEYENTVFFVYSDNGAAFQGFAHVPPSMTNHDRIAVNDISDAEFEQVIADLGSATSFLEPNVAWGQVSGTPHRGFKGDAFDGGTRGAAFVHYAGAKTTGVKSECLHSVMDIAPTILEMANADYPTEYRGKPNEPMDGKSMVGVLEGDFSCNTERSLGFELAGIKGLRKGDFKIAQANNQGTHLGLYNIVKDPFELNDLSGELPDLYSEMRALYQKYVDENGVVDVNSLYLPDLADSATTTAKIRGGSAAINLANITGRFKVEQSFAAGAAISIDGEIRPEAAHVGQSATVYVSVKDVDSGRMFYLTESGLVESSGELPYKTMEMPTMLTLSVIHGALSGTVLDGLTNLEVTIGYDMSGTRIDNTNKPIKVAITQ